MDNVSVTLDSSAVNMEYLEYLVIGAQAVVWVVGIGMYMLGIPVAMLLTMPPVILIFVIPFAYVIGMMLDSVSQFLLNPLRNAIKRWQLKDSDCPDEFIALHSPTLYHAYAWRARRARIPGSALINWPLLGLATLLHIGLGSVGTFPGEMTLGVIIVCELLTAFTWEELYRRAYAFRKGACAAIKKEFLS